MPTLGRIASILWFPFFLVASMSVLFIVTFAHPAPNGIEVAVVGEQKDVMRLQSQLDEVVSGGFEVRGLASASQAAQEVLRGDVAAALIPATRPRILLASGAGATRAAYLARVLPPVTDGEIEDLVPLMPGDPTGAGVFFYGLPLAIVAMVTSIVLLQLAMWSPRRRAAALGVIGAFAAVATYAVVIWQRVLPLTADSALLIAGAFALVLAIGLVLTGVSAFARQFFVPLALTFVLVIGVPTSGAVVLPDMLPTPLGHLHQLMPLGQFVDLVRALAYHVGSPVRPTLILLSWAALGAALNVLAAHTSTRAIRALRTST